MLGNPELLPEFDPVLYCELHADLAKMSPEEAQAHYISHGHNEGRVATLADAREGFLSQMVFKQDGDILEIGPFCAPILSGPHVYYLDVLGPAELRVRAQEHGLDPCNCPKTIHFVGALSEVDRKFDAVLCSHALEHQTDLIQHFKDISKILNPRGRYYLIIPDKRFCFDALMGESSVADVIQAYLERRRRHTAASVIEHLALTTHNDPARHWVGDHGVFDEHVMRDRIAAAIRMYERAGDGYIDAHAWRFTPDSFRKLSEILRRLDLIELNAVRVYNTPRDGLEFCAVLEAL